MYKKHIAILLLTLCFNINQQLWANIRLPNIIGSHMVLQQNSNIAIWGWGAPEEKVSIKTSWDTVSYDVVTGNGAKWITHIKTPTAGGPYQIFIKGNNEIVLDDVLIGEIWLCSGQSNMEWSGTQKLQQSIEEAPKANNKNIRFFYVAKATSNYPQENAEGHWAVCSPEEMFKFSAIGYFFGKQLESSLKNPIGLINANWGGTPAETWTPQEVVAASPELSAAAKKQQSTPWWSPRVGDSFNAMIAPLTNFSIAGVIWYQGESNVETYYGYEELFTKMIGAWRTAWNQNFPFYFVQIAPFAYGKKPNGAMLRAAQTKAANYPNTGMVVVSDLVTDTNNIHPVLKIQVAERLAKLALSKHYGFNLGIVESPELTSYCVEKNFLVLKVSNAENGLAIKGNSATHFEIAGDDKIFMPAQVKIQGNKIYVSHPKIKTPAAVRFGFNNTAMPNLFNKEGLPVNLFRTDQWDIAENN